MKKILFLAFFISKIAFSQESTLKNPEINNDSSEVPFAEIEQVPIYKGCSKNFNNVQLKKCMSDGISKHITKKFNLNVAKGLGLPDGKVRINVIFKINKKGEVVDIKTKAPHSELEKEAYRVVKMIPKLKAPGYQKGKPVIVPYSLPLIFNIDNSKYKKK